MSASNKDEALLKPARAMIRHRDFDGAVELLQKVLDDNPGSGDALELLGMACFMNRQPELAREAFERLTKEDPLRSSGWINFGAVLNQLGEHKKACDVLRRGLHRDRNNAEGYYNMGVAQRALKMNTMAITAYKEAIRCKPDMVDAHLGLGSLYAEMKNQGLAQKSFQEALRLNPSSKRARAMLDQALDVQREARKSESPFGRLVDEKELAARQQKAERQALTPAKRDEERELVHSIAKKIRPAAKEIVPLLDEDLHAHLHQLQVVTMQGDPRYADPDIHEQFVATLSTLKEFREAISGGVAELRSHFES